MKTKIDKNHPHYKPLHLHLEYFFRQQYCVIAVVLLMFVALLRTDGRLMSTLREAYAQGFGIVGQFMREETTRAPVTFNITAKVPTTSSR
jgi:hypothetical protein